MCRKGRALQEKRIVMPISGSKGLRKEDEFPPVFILMPGFKVQGAGKRKA